MIERLNEITKNMIIKPKSPKGDGWVLVGLSPQNYTLGYDGIIFSYPEMGFYVISAVEVANDEHDIDKGPEYHVSISKNGGRCSRNEARFITKCFDMQDADEDNHVPNGIVRNYWMPVAEKYIGHVCPCKETENAIVEDDGDYVWRDAP